MILRLINHFLLIISKPLIDILCLIHHGSLADFGDDLLGLFLEMKLKFKI